MIQRNFVVFTASVFLFLIVFSTSSLLAGQKVSNQPSETESLLVQSCRLNQNVLVQAASMNQRGQRENNRLNSPDHEGTDKPSFKSSNPQSAIQNPQSKAEVIHKTKKLQNGLVSYRKGERYEK